MTTANENIHIRSFSRRQGRITPAQRNALDTLWNTFGLDENVQLSAHNIFANNGPLIIDIGFGNGNNLTETAELYPENNYVGIEVHRPGVGCLLAQLQQRNLENVRVYCADAIVILKRNIPDACIDRVQLFFPDPWPKKRHHKRRLVTPDFAALIARKLRPGGHFHAVTDWENYAEYMLNALNTCAQLKNCAGNAKFIDSPPKRGLTKFEKRGIYLGHTIRDLIFERV